MTEWWRLMRAADEELVPRKLVRQEATILEMLALMVLPDVRLPFAVMALASRPAVRQETWRMVIDGGRVDWRPLARAIGQKRILWGKDAGVSLRGAACR